MKQKVAQEFLCGHCHIALHVSVCTVSPGECNISTLKRDQTMVGNGHSMGVAAEIFENMFRTAKWPFTVYYPVFTLEIANEGIKRLRIRKMLQLAVKADFAFGESLLEGVLNLSAKSFPERLLRQKVLMARIRRHPALMIKRQSTGRNDAVNMRMMLQSLGPGMEHAEEADLSSQEFGISGDFDQRFSAEAKQHRVDELLVLQCKLRQKTRHCEDNMCIGNRKKLFLPSFDPTKAGVGLAFWAMPIAA
jgi:hypothetical protein